MKSRCVNQVAIPGLHPRTGLSLGKHYSCKLLAVHITYEVLTEAPPLAVICNPGVIDKALHTLTPLLQQPLCSTPWCRLYQYPVPSMLLIVCSQNILHFFCQSSSRVLSFVCRSVNLRRSQSALETELTRDALHAVGRVDVLNHGNLIARC